MPPKDPPAGRTCSLSITSDLDGLRLDQALASLLPERSRSFLRKVLDADGCRRDGKPVKAALRTRAGEVYDLFFPEPAPLAASPEELPLTVLYEDDDLLVLDKRPGMVAHPSPGHAGGTLVNALLHHCGKSLSGIGGALRPGLVHRLDRDTSGCLAAAKSDAAHRGLVRQFTERGVEKIYLAVTSGVPRPLSGKVEANLGRHPIRRKFQAVLKSGGRPSLTLYRTLENYGALALVECVLRTGRTHQARVHLAHLGSPVLCDRDYGEGRDVFTAGDLEWALRVYRRGPLAPPPAGTGPELLSRQALHAWRLSFDHPLSGRRLSFEAPLPADLLSVLSPLREAGRRGGGSPGADPAPECIPPQSGG